MTEPNQAEGAAPNASVEAGDAALERDLELDIHGFEGPLHLLLALARMKKIDLTALSMTELADQYLSFLDAARAISLEIAGDYLVMAAWLVDLKSRALLPPPETPDDEAALSPEEAARRLAFRLQRLAAMRAAASDLMERDLLGRDVFARGAPEGLAGAGAPRWRAGLYDLVSAYASRRARTAKTRYRLPAPNVYSLEDARTRIAGLLDDKPEWTPLPAFLPAKAELGRTPPTRASLLASAFAAGLELARDGRAELRQNGRFTPVYLRRGSEATADADDDERS